MDVSIILQHSGNDFRVKKGEENNNITRNPSRSDILILLTLLSVDAKSVVLRVPSLTKVKVRNFSLLHFPKWFCLVDGQIAMSLVRVKCLPFVNANVSVVLIYNNGQLYRRYYFTCYRNSPLTRFSYVSMLLRLYSQFSFTKILKALHVLIFKAFWRNVGRPS